MLAPGLQLDSRSFTSAGRLLSLRSALILVQVALSLPLLVSAVLLMKSLQNLRARDTGFNKENVLFASVNPSLNGYPKEKTAAFFEELLARTRALPGVKVGESRDGFTGFGGLRSNRHCRRRLHTSRRRKGESLISPTFRATISNHSKFLSSPDVISTIAIASALRSWSSSTRSLRSSTLEPLT